MIHDTHQPEAAGQDEPQAAEAQGRYLLAVHEALTRLLEDGDSPGWKRVRSSKSALVAQTTQAPFFYAKIFFPRRWYEGVKTLFRGDRAYRTDWRTHALRSAGFSAPAVVLRGRVANLPFVITEAAPGMSLAKYLDQRARVPRLAGQPLADWRAALRSLGREIGRLHQAGFFHTELRTSNIQIESRPQGAARFSFIDNEGTRRFRHIPRWRRVKNLAQLNMDHPHISRTDRMRVFRAYLDAMGQGHARNQLAWEIHQRTQRRLMENASRRAADGSQRSDRNAASIRP
ncbi:lipopolysaccharide kinase InaA family protein [Candidatus Macondimonas diazotrophica]|uniref:Lipopolysaccharide kinase n=1 Tax=Candidatus Macondimonas diazotrophica TaxID=2305248 RepID=A0A4Z0FCM7_9GAMM|nr:lipopolysaccharide kinase InaA family protein [Candidatus Macondimonas diazotrophica]TFZ83601.1 hypothetical protein E4680_03645 [Candidatus Macondimonas diazotrophica]